MGWPMRDEDLSREPLHGGHGVPGEAGLRGSDGDRGGGPLAWRMGGPVGPRL